MKLGTLAAMCSLQEQQRHCAVHFCRTLPNFAVVSAAATALTPAASSGDTHTVASLSLSLSCSHTAAALKAPRRRQRKAAKEKERERERV